MLGSDGDPNANTQDTGPGFLLKTPFGLCQPPDIGDG